MHQPNTNDPDLLADAAAYVTELRDELEAEIGPVKPEAAREVFEMDVADPSLGAFVRARARHRRDRNQGRRRLALGKRSD
jgi:hypothetical protein